MVVLNASSSGIRFIWWCTTGSTQHTNQNLLIWWFNETFMIQITCSLVEEPELWNLSSRHVVRSRRLVYQYRLFWCLDPNDQCYDGLPRSLKGCNSELQSFLPTIANKPWFFYQFCFEFVSQAKCFRNRKLKLLY